MIMVRATPTTNGGVTDVQNTGNSKNGIKWEVTPSLPHSRPVVRDNSRKKRQARSGAKRRQKRIYGGAFEYGYRDAIVIHDAYKPNR